MKVSFPCPCILFGAGSPALWKDFEEILLPVNPDSDRYGPSQRPRIAKMLEHIVINLLFEFFEADGDGIEKDYLENSTVLLRRVIGTGPL